MCWSGSYNFSNSPSLRVDDGLSTITIKMKSAADRLREARTFGDVRDKLVYIAPLYTEEFHLLAGRKSEV
jgi:hypothetical protein